MEALKSVGKVILEKYPATFFGLDEVVEASGAERIPARRALERLCRDGIVRKIEKCQKSSYAGGDEWKQGRPILQITYRLADKAGLAERIAPRLKEGTACDRMWKVIRYQKNFSRRDLVVLAQVTFENAKWYTKRLRDHGIIESSRRAGPGVEWRLVKDPGARRPALTEEAIPEKPHDQ